MKFRLHTLASGLLAFSFWSPLQSWATGSGSYCNTNSDETKAVSAYELSGQGNFSCSDLNMVPASASIINPSALGGKGIDWQSTGSDVDAVTVSDSKGKRCVYNYGGGATGGQRLTPNSTSAATDVLVCRDGNVVPPPNFPPVVTITLPSSQTFAGGATIDFSATAEDPEDGPIDPDTIVWNSSLEGLIGVGGSFSATLVAGTHRITAQAKDSEGLLGSDEVTITVEATIVPLCEQADNGNVLINGTEVNCPTDGSPRVVCSADISEEADKFELSQQACCVCGAVAIECNPDLPAGATVLPGEPGPCPVAETNNNLQVPTTIMFNNDPYYCVTSGGARKCYAY